jgi:hypothetical protein
MHKPAQLVGERFGRWLVAAPFGSRVNGSLWLCRCDCGEERILQVSCLRNGSTKSCGCLRNELLLHGHINRGHVKHGHFKHGRTGTRTWVSWRAMLTRCTNPKRVEYKHYGGRGIAVCERWTGKRGFENFLADMGERPADKSLDRFPNNDGNYEPGNARWATRKEQRANKFRREL